MMATQVSKTLNGITGILKFTWLHHRYPFLFNTCRNLFVNATKRHAKLLQTTTLSKSPSFSRHSSYTWFGGDFILIQHDPCQEHILFCSAFQSRVFLQANISMDTCRYGLQWDSGYAMDTCRYGLQWISEFNGCNGYLKVWMPKIPVGIVECGVKLDTSRYGLQWDSAYAMDTGRYGLILCWWRHGCNGYL